MPTHQSHIILTLILVVLHKAYRLIKNKTWPSFVFKPIHARGILFQNIGQWSFSANRQIRSPTKAHCCYLTGRLGPAVWFGHHWLTNYIAHISLGQHRGVTSVVCSSNLKFLLDKLDS